jgi:5-methylcytosine-specific restriction endonuclease McrA
MAFLSQRVALTASQRQFSRLVSAEVLQRIKKKQLRREEFCSSLGIRRMTFSGKGVQDHIIARRNLNVSDKFFTCSFGCPQTH